MWKDRLADMKSMEAVVQGQLKATREGFRPGLENELKADYPDDAKRRQRADREEALYKEFVADTGLGEISPLRRCIRSRCTRRRCAAREASTASAGMMTGKMVPFPELTHLSTSTNRVRIRARYTFTITCIGRVSWRPVAAG